MGFGLSEGATVRRAACTRKQGARCIVHDSNRGKPPTKAKITRSSAPRTLAVLAPLKAHSLLSHALPERRAAGPVLGPRAVDAAAAVEPHARARRPQQQPAVVRARGEAKPAGVSHRTRQRLEQRNDCVGERSCERACERPCGGARNAPAQSKAASKGLRATVKRWAVAQWWGRSRSKARGGIAARRVKVSDLLIRRTVWRGRAAARRASGPACRRAPEGSGQR